MGPAKKTWEQKREAREARIAARGARHKRKIEREARLADHAKPAKQVLYGEGRDIFGEMIRFRHGTIKGYDTHRCRCAACRAAKKKSAGNRAAEDYLRTLEMRNNGRAGPE
jgi:hypothetical protein